MRPIYFGLILFVVGVVGYLGVSVYYDLITLQMALIYMFAAVAISSLPIAALLEIIRWRKTKTDKQQKE